MESLETIKVKRSTLLYAFSELSHAELKIYLYVLMLMGKKNSAAFTTIGNLRSYTGLSTDDVKSAITNIVKHRLSSARYEGNTIYFYLL